MDLQELSGLLGLKTLVAPRDPGRKVMAGYASDLLSCVMAKAVAGTIWVTLQAHPNIVAVASLLDMAGIIVTEDSPLDDTTIARAVEEGVALYHSPLTTYSMVARLAQAGIPGVDM